MTMTTAYLSIAAIVLMAVAGYAQYLIGVHTVARRVALTRAILGIVGALFGITAAATARETGLNPLLAFLAGFGVVHVPAAIILFFKHARHEGRT